MKYFQCRRSPRPRPPSWTTPTSPQWQPLLSWTTPTSHQPRTTGKIFWNISINILILQYFYSADYSAPEADSSYLAPAPSDEIPVYEEEVLDTYEEPLDTYEEPLDGYNDELDAAASDAEAADPLKMLMNAVPGVPGEDYPIYAEVKYFIFI